ncbi:hypothetical protein J2S46_004046 [Kitasatospora herbaricolor]|uniref:hypothetical protein n=1 Tax=Kitasatospora herbaricolor TaxID=68217 RepID=UPI00174CABED|nr:hypothetical protein [Kitasatospora herbaricolor]MDQ0309490.1 hypothetical protein [Kitasatospora herbaricolor]
MTALPALGQLGFAPWEAVFVGDLEADVHVARARLEHGGRRGLGFAAPPCSPSLASTSSSHT